MDWVKKQLGGGDGNIQNTPPPFIIGSDRWLASSSPPLVNPPPQEHATESSPREVAAPAAVPKDSKAVPDSAPSIFSSNSGNDSVAIVYPRIDSMEGVHGSSEAYGDQIPNYWYPYATSEPAYDGAEASPPSDVPNSGIGVHPNLSPGIIGQEFYSADESTALQHHDECAAAQVLVDSVDSLSIDGANEQARAPPVDTREEVLVDIPGAIVHLIDKEQSVHLASGKFSLVRLTQSGNGIAVLARVGTDLQWPLTKDEAAVKLDQSHYFFSLSIPPEIEQECSSSTQERSQPKDASCSDPCENILNYGVTFTESHDAATLNELDELLRQYSFFTTPAIVKAESEKEKLSVYSKTGVGAGENGDKSPVEIQKDGNVVQGDESPEDSVTDSREAQIASAAQLALEPTEKLLEQGSAEYWTTLAPNVEDYSSGIAKAIAAGTGHIIKGLFWCSEATVAQLQRGNEFMKARLKPKDEATKISARAMRRICRARKISIMSEQVASGVLSGVVKAAAFITNPMVKSKAGQKVLSLLPGEIALASLDAFGKLFDAVEFAGKNVLATTSVVTTGLVSQRYGGEAAEFTQEGLGTAGHFLTTAWTVSKIRKVFYPSGLAKSAAKSAAEDLKQK